MKITFLMAFVATLAVLFACLLPVLIKHGFKKTDIRTARERRFKVRFKKLNLMEQLFAPFVRAMEALQLKTQRMFGASRLVAANIAEGTHAAAINKLTDAAITTRHLLYKRGSDDNHIAVAGASDTLCPIGTIDDEASAAEENVAVQLLGKGPTKRMVASEAITVGDEVWTAASGKVQDRTATAGTYWIVGTALSAASGDGEIFEVQCCAPIRITIP